MSSRLDKLDLSLRFTDKDEYEKSLEEWQLRLLKLEQTLRNSSHSLLVVFEGWDAAGKGGAIKRLTDPLDPRGYRVYGISAPTPEEKSRHYLWRFWNRVPAAGELVIFDRSWYGRVLVERVEGYATEAEWRRAYGEINDFEETLEDAGVIVLKFWLHISADEQLKRFREREENPFKQWKITPDDWRNREQRPAYLEAVEEMLDRTDTRHCPWRLVAAEHKWYARLSVLKTVVKELEQVLGKSRG